MESQKTPEHTFLVDLDGSVADYHLSMRRSLERLRGPDEPDIDWAAFGREVPDHIEARMAVIKTQPGFWRDLQPIEDGLEVVRLIELVGFEPTVLTKGPRKTISAWTEKVEWCQKHLPEVPITVTQDKGLVYGRGLFDDFPPYVERWLQHRPRGLVLMLDQPWNQGFTHPNVVRIPRPFRGEDVVGPVRDALQKRRDAYC